LSMTTTGARMAFAVGAEYKRSLIHDNFGGSRYSGISPSAKSPNIFIFTGKSGHQYGYQDEWDGDNFLYTGEGQVGDQQMAVGNLALSQHAKTGKSVHLFEASREAHVRYVGQVTYLDHHVIRTPDRNGEPRDAYRFVLKRAPGASAEQMPVSDIPNATERRGLVTSRVGQGKYRQALLKKFNFQCAVTGCALQEVLIASHILPWADANDTQRLDPNNGILLSPNYDAAFDRSLISFDDDGSIIFSELLREEDRRALCLSPSAYISVNEEMRPYLREHREKLRRLG
jgi:5-methylcytosine-specific restriction enzyme A